MDAEETRNGTYRCPVCGHREDTDLDDASGPLRVRCSYCDTLLEVSARGEDSIRLHVQVAEEGEGQQP